MGSFNVSCGISRLSINYGDRCALLPLIRSPYNKNGVIESTSMFVGYETIFQPFCFPIFGTYDDYGSLEKIEKDSNTKAIEEYLGMSIENYVSLITDGRNNVYDKFSNYCTILYDNPQNLDYDYDIKTFLKEIGFVNKDGKYVIEEKCEVIIDGDNFNVIFLVNSINKSYYKYDKNHFLQDYFKLYDEYLGISEENLKKLKIISQTSAMFMLRDVYDFYALNQTDKQDISDCRINETMLMELGFIPDEKYVNFTKDNITVSFKDYFPKIKGIDFFYGEIHEFIKIYKEKNGEKLDLSKYEKMDSFDLTTFNFKWEFKRRLQNVVTINKRYFELIKEEIPDLTNEENIAKFIVNHSNELAISKEILFKDFYLMQKCNYFYKIYLSSLIKFENIDFLTQFSRFYESMQLSNILLFPTYCGTQCGCRQAEVKLSYIINKIVEKREQELKEEIEEEYTPINPLEGFNDAFY